MKRVFPTLIFLLPALGAACAKTARYRPYHAEANCPPKVVITIAKAPMSCQFMGTLEGGDEESLKWKAQEIGANYVQVAEDEDSKLADGFWCSDEGSL